MNQQKSALIYRRRKTELCAKLMKNKTIMSEKINNTGSFGTTFCMYQ
jgi:hypothetical protein